MEFQQYRPMITDLTDRIYSTADCRRHHKQTWKQQALQTEKTLAIKKSFEKNNPVLQLIVQALKREVSC